MKQQSQQLLEQKSLEKQNSVVSFLSLRREIGVPFSLASTYSPAAVT